MTVIRNDLAARVQRIDPDIVLIGIHLRHRADRRAAVGRAHQSLREEVDFVGVVGQDAEPREIARPIVDPAVAAHQRPLAAAIVGSPQIALVCRLDRGVDARRVARGDPQTDAPERRRRQAVPGQVRPRGPAVARDVNTAAGPPALRIPGMNRELPHRGEERLRIGRIHHDIDGAGVLVHEQDALPCSSAVECPKYAALGLRAIAVPQRRDIYEIGVGRVDRDAGNASRVLEAHVCPRLPAIHRLEDAVADGDVAPDERLAGANPDDVRLGWSDRDCANRGDFLVVEQRLPVQARVRRLEQAARGCARINDGRISCDARHGHDAVPGRTDEPERK